MSMMPASMSVMHVKSVRSVKSMTPIKSMVSSGPIIPAPVRSKGSARPRICEISRTPINSVALWPIIKTTSVMVCYVVSSSSMIYADYVKSIFITASKCTGGHC